MFLLGRGEAEERIYKNIYKNKERKEGSRGKNGRGHTRIAIHQFIRQLPVALLLL